jgi:prolyl 4-hydroxylase
MPWSLRWIVLAVLAFLSSLVVVVLSETQTQTQTQQEEGSCRLDDATCASPDWGVEQDLRDPAALGKYRTTETYMEEVVMIDPAYEKVRGLCKFDNALCTYWSAIGECDRNPTYMRQKCSPSCQSCDQLDWSLRCQFDPNQLVWNETGKVNALMKRIVRDYDAVVWSEDPWVVTIDDFLSEQDCQTLIDWGNRREFERSMDAGKILEDGTMDSIVSKYRTSTNAWCLEGCFEDSITQAMLDRLEAMLGIPRIHYECTFNLLPLFLSHSKIHSKKKCYSNTFVFLLLSQDFQLLKYQVGQFYRRHHDYNPTELDRPQGNRILTAYVYLNDVPAGGGTKFNSIRGGLEITPKRGRILLWPSVKDSDPTKMDGRTDHEALPVEEGVKFGANIWIHQVSFDSCLLTGGC